MTIQSYLVYAEPGRAKFVEQALHAIPGCDVTPAVSHEVFVLVTESTDEAGQKELDGRLASLEGITCLAMVGGWTA